MFLVLSGVGTQMPKAGGREVCKNRLSDEAFIFGVSIIALAGPLPRPMALSAPSSGHCRLPRKLLSRSFIRCLCNEFVHGPKDSHSLAPSLTHSSIYLETDARRPPSNFAPEFLECFAHKYLCEALGAVGGIKRCVESRLRCSLPSRQKTVIQFVEAAICIEGRHDHGQR